MNKKSLLPLVVGVGLVLAACTPPNPSNRRLSNVGLSSDPSPEAMDPLASPSPRPASQPTPSPTPTKSTLDFLKPGGDMKTLADFEQIAATQATLKTTQGDITFELYREQAPITTANFLNLAKSGFYDGIVFHRVIADFMAQVGDPLTKDEGKKQLWGTGDPGYKIPDEFGEDLKHDSPGMVSMANSGPNTGGSQFFITYGPTSWLDGKHTIFGKVTEGMEVLQKIQVGDKILSVSYE